MQEGRRQAYLAALGVDLYVARAPLPGAAPSWFPEWEVVAEQENFGEALVVEAVDGEVLSDEQAYFSESGYSDAAFPSKPPFSGAHSTETTASAAIKSAPAASTSKTASATPPIFDDPSRPIPTLRNLKNMDEPVSVTPSKTSATDALRVGLAVFEWPGRLRVLIEMQDPDAPSLSAREHRLWGEISLALMGREQAAQGHALPLFRFPPNRQLKRLQTPQHVREAVESFLQARQARSAVSATVMLAGEGLASAFTGKSGNLLAEPMRIGLTGAMQGAAPLSFESMASALMLPSLLQMLSDWRLKPQAWAALSHFAREAGILA